MMMHSWIATSGHIYIYIYMWILIISSEEFPEKIQRKYSWEIHAHLHLQTGGLPLLLHNPSSWHTAVACWLDSSLKPSLHSYINLLPKVNSLPITEPFPGESGIPQDTAEKKGKKNMKNWNFIISIFKILSHHWNKKHRLVILTYPLHKNWN